jgi:hypothetical protein
VKNAPNIQERRKDMVFKKKGLLLFLCISIFSALMLIGGNALGSQTVKVPYATLANGWWSGIAITNTSSHTITPIVYVYNSDGTSHCTSLSSIASGAIYADLIGNIIPSATLTSRVWVTVANNSDDEFDVTLFVGRTDGGFGFQSFHSEDKGSIVFLCIP